MTATQVVARLAAIALLLVPLGACGAGDDDGDERKAREGLDALASGVMENGEDVVDTLDTAGLDVASAEGVGERCQMEPAPGLTFGFGARLTESAAYAEQYDAALDALEDDGWEVTDSGTASVRGAAASAWARLARADYTLALDRTVREGSDALVLGLRRADDCIDVPDGSVGVPTDLERVVLVGDGPDDGPRG